MFTISDVRYLTAAAVSKLILAEQAAANPTFAIVDVRDGDYIGGHIKGSRHVPSQSFEVNLPDMVREFQGKKTVIFHCMLSQQRGPGAAVRYMRQRELTFPGTTNVEARMGASTDSDEAANTQTADSAQPAVQTVYCLRGGFTAWQAEFATDEKLTEGYRKELWEDM